MSGKVRRGHRKLVEGVKAENQSINVPLSRYCGRVCGVFVGSCSGRQTPRERVREVRKSSGTCFREWKWGNEWPWVVINRSRSREQLRVVVERVDVVKRERRDENPKDRVLV
jgi:hypothetical protein